MVPRVKSALLRSLCRVLIAGSSFGLLGACGGEEFSSAPAGSGGSAAGAGGSANAGTGGGGSSAGGTTSGGSAGTGAGGGSSCACSEGQYCSAGRCRECSDLSSIAFGEPQDLGATGLVQGAATFPRAGDTAASLFYSTGNPGQGYLHYTADLSSDAGQRISGASAPFEVAPLFIQNSGGLDFDFLFTRTMMDGTTDIMTASWEMGAFSNVAAAPGLLNVDGASDYSAAFATGTARFWWMSDRDGLPQLFTSEAGDATSSYVALQVPAGSTTRCDALASDLTPWATDEGNLLLFSAESFDAQCVPVDGTSDLYAVLLDTDDGQPAAQVIALDDVNQAGSSETTPSLSVDRCWLYFASDVGDSTFSLYRAPRR